MTLFKNKKDMTEQEIIHRNYRQKKAVTSFVWPLFRFLILFGLCFVIMYPLIFMVSAAFRPSTQMADPSIMWIPRSLTFSNIADAWRSMEYPKTLWTTIYLNLGSSLMSVASCAITGYGFARFKFKLRGPLFGLVIMMIVVPPQILSIPQFMQFRYWDFSAGLINSLTGWSTNLIDTVWPMYLPALLGNGLRSGLFILIFRQFFRGLPKELEDAAYLDGCGPFRTFLTVMVPNAASSFLTVFLLSVVWYWNDSYMSVMFYTDNRTMSLMVSNLGMMIQATIFDNRSVNANELIVWMQAGCLLAILPILVMYVSLQKYFTEGIERSGLVG